jgi:hypothetical protein
LVSWRDSFAERVDAGLWRDRRERGGRKRDHQLGELDQAATIEVIARDEPPTVVEQEAIERCVDFGSESAHLVESRRRAAGFPDAGSHEVEIRVGTRGGGGVTDEGSQQFIPGQAPLITTGEQEARGEEVGSVQSEVRSVALLRIVTASTKMSPERFVVEDERVDGLQREVCLRPQGTQFAPPNVDLVPPRPVVQDRGGRRATMAEDGKQAGCEPQECRRRRDRTRPAHQWYRPHVQVTADEGGSDTTQGHAIALIGDGLCRPERRRVEAHILGCGCPGEAIGEEGPRTRRRSVQRVLVDPAP